MAREEEVRTIAYGIWEQDGRPDGRDVDHWLRAEVAWEAQAATRQASSGPGKPTFAAGVTAKASLKTAKKT